jgi:PhoPQ-activated pathogenicity-related protein
MKFLSIILSIIFAVSADVISDYVSEPDENYNWVYEKDKTFRTLWGSTAHVLNVTSQKWMDESRGYGPRGAIWDHYVIVIVPNNLKYSNFSTVWLTGDSNTHPGADNGIKRDNYDILVGDEIAHNTRAIAVVVKQIPNAPYVFPNDPDHKKRHEDSLLAWSWREFHDDP